MAKKSRPYGARRGTTLNKERYNKERGTLFSDPRNDCGVILYACNLGLPKEGVRSYDVLCKVPNQKRRKERPSRYDEERKEGNQSGL